MHLDLEIKSNHFFLPSYLHRSDTCRLTKSNKKSQIYGKNGEKTLKGRQMYEKKHRGARAFCQIS